MMVCVHTLGAAGSLCGDCAAALVTERDEARALVMTWKRAASAEAKKGSALAERDQAIGLLEGKLERAEANRDKFRDAILGQERTIQDTFDDLHACMHKGDAMGGLFGLASFGWAVYFGAVQKATGLDFDQVVWRVWATKPR